jgi:hypothetical protein
LLAAPDDVSERDLTLTRAEHPALDPILAIQSFYVMAAGLAVARGHGPGPATAPEQSEQSHAHALPCRRMQNRRLMQTPVGAAGGCDLLILLQKNKIKRSQPRGSSYRNGYRPKFPDETEPCTKTIKS